MGNRAAHQPPRSTFRTGLPVMLAMVAVVACFGATVTFGQLRLRPINNHAIDIIDDAVPGLVQLSTLDSELLQLGLRVNEAVDDANGDTAMLEHQLAGARHRIDDGIASYQSLPTTPGETTLVDIVIADLALLDEASAAVVRDLAVHSEVAANDDLRKRFHPRLEQTAADVASLRTLNSDIVTSRTARMTAAYHDATDIVRICGVLSLLIAVGATVLVVRALRNRTKLMEERDRLLAERATELEAFAGRIAHDLRNPLSVMLMRVMTVQERTDLPGEARDHLGKAARQVDRMATMIDGMLEFARAGAAATPDARTDVKEVLDEVLADVALAIESGAVAIDVVPFPAVAVASSHAALTAVLSNLVTNAMKYGRGGQGIAAISVRVDDRDRMVHVEVADRGPGVAAEDTGAVFEPFRQLAGSRTGIGLGLATVKKVVESSGGAVGVASTPGHGATFWFDMPKAR